MTDEKDMLEVEKCVIGSILMDSNCLKSVHGMLEAKHFSTPVLKRAYTNIIESYEAGSTVTTATLINLMKKDREESDWLMEMVNDCTANAVTAIQIKRYVKDIIDFYNSKEVQKILYKDRYGQSADEIIQSVMEELSGLKKEKAAQNSMTIAEVYMQNKEKYFNPKYNPNLIKFGIKQLDDLIGGVEETDLVCIGARPSVGKSVFALTLARNVCKEKKVILYSLEMNKKQLLDRILAESTDIDLKKIRTCNSFETKEQEERFNQKVLEEICNNNNLIINDTGELRVSDVKNECKYIDNLGAIFIDYIQLMRCERKSKAVNRAQEVGEISKALKALSMDIKVPIIVLSQLNRALEYRADKEPVLADLRESGDIEQDCNIIMFLWSPEPNNQEIKGVSVAKNRQGQVGKMKLIFKGNVMRFKELESSYRYQQNTKPNSEMRK